eukprot:5474611-Amphidinium_carterae.1
MEVLRLVASEGGRVVRMVIERCTVKDAPPVLRCSNDLGLHWLIVPKRSNLFVRRVLSPTGRRRRGWLPLAAMGWRRNTPVVHLLLIPASAEMPPRKEFSEAN